MAAPPSSAFWLDFRMVSIGVSAFVATNLDDFFILIGFFADPEFSGSDIVVGQYLGMAALALICGLAATPALVVPHAWLGLLGLIPLWLGCRALWQRWRRRPELGSSQWRPRRSRGKLLTVALVTIANGADNVGVFAPLFATRNVGGIGMILVVFAVMTGLWCAGAGWTVRHPRWGAPIHGYGQEFMPFVLIGLGLLILTRLVG